MRGQEHVEEEEEEEEETKKMKKNEKCVGLGTSLEK